MARNKKHAKRLKAASKHRRPRAGRSLEKRYLAEQKVMNLVNTIKANAEAQQKAREEQKNKGKKKPHVPSAAETAAEVAKNLQPVID